METFWKWLMRTNARAVFLCALIALILISGWWWWKLSRPPQYEEIKMVSTPKTRTHVGLGINTLFSEEQKKMQYDENNPFNAEDIQFYYTSPPPSLKPKLSGVIREPSTQPPSRKPSPQVSKSEPVYLTYKGLFQRTDGKIVALIENSKSKQSEFYEGGQEISGLKINEIRMEEVLLTNSVGEEVIIKRGVAWEVKKTKTGDGNE